MPTAAAAAGCGEADKRHLGAKKTPKRYLYLLEDVMPGPVRVSHMQLHH